MPKFRTPSGGTIEIDEERGRGLGYEPVSFDEQYGEAVARGVEARRREDSSAFRAATLGTLSGLTAGLSDVALGASATDAQRELFRADEQYQGGWRTGGEIVGSLAGALAAPGTALARSPAGVLSSFTASQAEKGTARALAAMGAEGAAYASGQYLGHVALEDKEATAEGLLGSAGLGFGFGAAAGGAALGVAKGTMSARKLFSKMRGGEKAAADAAVEFERVGRDILDAHESAATAARAELDALRAERQAAKKQAHIDSVYLAQEQARARAAGPREQVNEVMMRPDHAAASVDDLIAGSPGAARHQPTPTEQPWRAVDLAAPGEVVPAKIGPTTSGSAELDQAFGSAGALAERLGERNLVRGAPALTDEAAVVAGGSVPKTEVVRGGRGRAVAKDATTAVETVVPGAPGKTPPRNATEAFADQEAPLLAQLEASVANPGAKVGPARGASKRELELEALLLDLTEKRGRAFEVFAADPEVAASAWFKDVHGLYATAEDFGGHAAVNARMERQLGPASDALERMTERAPIAGKQPYTSPEMADVWVQNIQAKSAAKRPGTGTEVLASGAEDVGRAPTILAEGTPVPPADVKAAVGKRGKAERLAQIDAELEQIERRVASAADDGERAWAQREGERLADEANAIEESMSGGDLAGQARRITEYEEAANKLADAMGQSVDPRARELMKAFQDAHDEAGRKVMDRIARAADDASAFGPRELSPSERIAYARAMASDSAIAAKEARYAEGVARENAADAKRARDAVFKKDADAEKAALRAQRANSARQRFSSSNSWANVGSALEMGDLAGIDIPGIPKPHDLPVVGPLLGLWLKLRVAKGVLERGMGRVSATADARVAAAATKTQDRIATALDGMFAKAPAKAEAAARPSAIAAGVLSRRVFDDGGEHPPENASAGQHAAARAREIQAYVSSPNAIENDVRRELAGVVDPDVIAATEKARRAAYQYLADNAPKVPATNPLNPAKYEVPPAEAMKFGRRMATVNDPALAFEAARNGTLTVEMADAVRVAFPRLFQLGQLRIADMMGQVKEPLPYRTRALMTLLFDTPLDASLDPRSLRIAQSIYAPPAGAPPTPGPGATPPVPSIAGDVNINQYYQPPGAVGRR